MATATSRSRPAALTSANNLSGVDIAAAEANSDVQLFREYTMDNCYLSFNQREEPFTDVRVRQAIAYALDIDGAWNVCMDGVGQPAKGVLPDNVTDSIAKGGFSLSRGLPRLPVQSGKGQGVAG